MGEPQWQVLSGFLGTALVTILGILATAVVRERRAEKKEPVREDAHVSAWLIEKDHVLNRIKRTETSITELRRTSEKSIEDNKERIEQVARRYHDKKGADQAYMLRVNEWMDGIQDQLAELKKEIEERDRGDYFEDRLKEHDREIREMRRKP